MTDFNGFNPNNRMGPGFGIPQNKKQPADAAPPPKLDDPAASPAQNASLKTPDTVFDFISQQSQGVGQSIKTEQMMSQFDMAYEKAAQQIKDVYLQEFGKPVPDKLLPLMVDRYLNNQSEVVIQS
jgi:hypothetical protein